MELPELNDKQNKCLMRYLTNNFNKNEAYRFAYNCENMNDNSIAVEASRFFKNPKITPWLEYFRNNQQKTVQEELNYKAINHFNELNEMKDAAMSCADKYDNPNVNVALRAVELKGKLAGLYKDNSEEFNSGVVTMMGTINIDGKNLDFQVGEPCNDNPARNS